MREQAAAQVASAIASADRIALCAHVSPDGDTIGSTLGLGLGLIQLGKAVTLFCQDKVPDNLHFLPGWEMYRKPEEAGDASFDLLVAVDAADLLRLGTGASLREISRHTAQVDHHGTNPHYMQVNLVDATASATSLLIFGLLKMMGVKLNREIAMCLYTGISTDTGNFSFGNTTEEAFQVVGELMRYQIPLPEMSRTLFRERTKAQFLLTRRAMDSIMFWQDDQVAGMKLAWKDFLETGTLSEHADTIVNLAMDIAGVEMAFLVRETADGSVKASLRARAPRKVDQLAASLGGGGHAQAAGCTLSLPLDEAVETIASAMVKSLGSPSAPDAGRV